MLCAIGAFYFLYHRQAALAQPVAVSGEEQEVRNVVTEFGSKLQKEDYAPYVSADILSFWMNDPSKAPGRLTSSPWPDRIEITDLERESDGAYYVAGKIVEITNQGGVAAETAVAMRLRKENGKWTITGFEMTVPHQDQ